MEDSKPLYLTNLSLFCKELRQLNLMSLVMPQVLINQFMYKVDHGEQFTIEEIAEINIQFLRNKLIYNLILTKIVNNQPQTFIYNDLS
jgi:hypothetical protein